MVQVPDTFLTTIAPTLRSLDLSRNEVADLAGLYTSQLAPLANLASLQILKMHHNKLATGILIKLAQIFSNIAQP